MHYLFSMCVTVLRDVRMEHAPLSVMPVHEPLRQRVCSLPYVVERWHAALLQSACVLCR